MIKLEKLLVF